MSIIYAAPSVCCIRTGSMSLTRIKDAFAIFKNLVLESRGSGGGANAPAVSEGDPELTRQVEDLRSCLLQRDTEIAILVNMVKKGKVNVLVDSSDTDASVGATSLSNDRLGPLDDFGLSRGASLHASNGSKHSARGDVNGSKKEIDTKASVSTTPSSQSTLKEDRENRIVKRHLFGVPPPDDRRIFDDMSG